MAVDDGDARRDTLRAFLQEQGPATPRPAVLTGYVLIEEWMEDTGDRFLTMGHDHTIGHWHAQGMLWSALTDWPEGNADD